MPLGPPALRRLPLITADGTVRDPGVVTAPTMGNVMTASREKIMDGIVGIRIVTTNGNEGRAVHFTGATGFLQK